MKQYQDLLRKITLKGVDKSTGVRTKWADGSTAGYRSIEGEMLKFDLQEGFPLSTLSRKSLHLILTELLWFTNGDTNLKTLLDAGNPIWTANAHDQDCRHAKAEHPYRDSHTLEEFTKLAREEGYDLGPVYGKQWRNFGGVDQLQSCIDKIINQPNDRRMIVSAWNPVELPDMALPPCHLLYQFFVYPLSIQERIDLAYKTTFMVPSDLDNWGGDREDDEEAWDEAITKELDVLKVPKQRVSMTMYQRSVDTLLGLPFNIASYAALLHMVGGLTNSLPSDLTMFLGDCHIYDRHFEQVKEILRRTPRPLPQLSVTPLTQISEYKLKHFSLTGYDPMPHIKGDMAV